MYVTMVMRLAHVRDPKLAVDDSEHGVKKLSSSPTIDHIAIGEPSIRQTRHEARIPEHIEG